MKTLRYILLIITVGLLSSCLSELDQYPKTETTSSDVYAEAKNYKMVLGKLYASFVTTGQEKEGNNDLSSNSGEDYMRCYFNLQEAGTDELASTWLEGDKVGDITYLTWDENDPWVSDMYYRIYYTIALCNEFIRNSSDSHIARFTDAEQQDIINYRAEARFLRALAYSHALDLFRNIPFVSENDPVGSFIPPRYTGSQVFEYVEKELIDLEKDLLDRS
ncbi:MAG: RagB/SusD family nutrient uptake outer membrane protein, partial [Bacteroides sp.]|nr:RagB/SusD family nutrient uptake outer membrane protein [Bacteroides sp.]